MKTMKGHSVIYVEDSLPKLKTFKTKESLTKWVNKFKKANDDREMDGYWIDAIVYGTVTIPESSGYRLNT